MVIKLIALSRKKVELWGRDYERCCSKEAKEAIVALIAEREEFIEQLEECI